MLQGRKSSLFPPPQSNPAVGVAKAVGPLPQCGESTSSSGTNQAVHGPFLICPYCSREALWDIPNLVPLCAKLLKIGCPVATQPPLRLHSAMKAGKRKHVRNVSLTRYILPLWFWTCTARFAASGSIDRRQLGSAFSLLPALPSVPLGWLVG
jgi:hypothetical protein